MVAVAVDIPCALISQVSVCCEDWRPDIYSASEQVPLIQPCEVGGNRMGCYTIGSTTYNVTQSAIGDFTPFCLNGVASGCSTQAPFQGMAAYAPRTAVMNTLRINVLPRFGFAYDVFGNGKTALRGGFSIFSDVFGTVDTVGGLVLMPPPPNILSNPSLLPLPATNRQQLVITPSVLNSTVPQMQSGFSTFLGPQAVSGLPRTFDDPESYTWNLDIQHDLGHGLLLDIGYVGHPWFGNGTNGGFASTTLATSGGAFAPGSNSTFGQYNSTNGSSGYRVIALAGKIMF